MASWGRGVVCDGAASGVGEGEGGAAAAAGAAFASGRSSSAIARKILYRESQIDPLLLTGLVHVALEKLDAGTRVRLKVHPADTHFWNEFFARSASPLVPELSGDPALRHGECTLETEVGSTQISMETQLKEIEQGFFDLLEQRPKVR